MNTLSPSPSADWRHSHVFDEGNPLAERNTLLATVLTALMMVAEIAGGWYYNSMALLADGWHMSSHVVALGLAWFAYVVARRLAGHAHFAFGTWKIEILGSYTSAVLLMGVALLMVFQSVERLLTPAPIHYDEAIAIAAIGLAVNLACAWLLRGAHHHHHHHHHHHDGHDHADDHADGHTDGPGDHGHPHRDHAHGDLNLRSAYVHVLADAATSVLAIVALFGGKLWGASWLDPVMGLVGAAVVAVWSWGLLRHSGRVLLDAEMDAPVVAEVREAIEGGPIPASICDLHVWRVAAGKYACIVALRTPSAEATPDDFRRQLAVHEELVHVSVEVNRVAAR